MTTDESHVYPLVNDLSCLGQSQMMAIDQTLHRPWPLVAMLLMGLGLASGISESKVEVARP